MDYYVFLTILLLFIQISYGSTNEHIQISRKLKELFVSDFGAFLDYAIDEIHLYFLEMEIPLQFFSYLRMYPPIASDAPEISIIKCGGVNSYFEISGKLTNNSYFNYGGSEKSFFSLTTNKYGSTFLTDSDDNLIRMGGVANTVDLQENIWQQRYYINLQSWNTIKFKLFFQKDLNHQILIFGKLFPFSGFRITSKYGLFIYAEGVYSDKTQKLIYYQNEPKPLLDIWEYQYGVTFNFEWKNPFHFSKFLDPNANFYLNPLQSKYEECDGLEDPLFFEENVFHEENSFVEETISKFLNSNTVNNSEDNSNSPSLHEQFNFKIQVLENLNTEFVNPYLKDSFPEYNNQNSLFRENNFVD